MALGLSVGFCSVPLLYALPASADLLEEVIVTAQKREQSLQDVGIAVSAFTSEQMDNLGWTDTTQVASMTSGVFVSGSAGGQNAQFTIRGVTQNDFLEAIEGPTSIYLDEGLVIQQNSGTFGLFDIDRVEVLKGPQGTLFGRNATGGLVHFITRKPTDEADGYVNASYGDYNLVNVRAALSGSVSDSVTARAALYYNRHDEIMNNVYDDSRGATELRTAADFDVPNASGTPVAGGQQDKWNDDTLAGRVSFMFDLSEDSSLYVMAHGSETTQSEAPYQSRPAISVYDENGLIVDSQIAGPNELRQAIGPNGEGINEPLSLQAGTERPCAGCDLFGYRDPDGADHDFAQDFSFDDQSSFDMYGVNGKFVKDFDSFSFVAIGDYKDFQRSWTVDIDQAPIDQLSFDNIAETESFTAEFRLEGETDKFQWIGGLYYLYAENSVDNGFIISPSSVFAAVLGNFETVLPVDAVNEVELDTDSYSAFGQLDINLTENLLLTVGGRVIREEKNYTFNQTLYTPGSNPAKLDTETVVSPLPNFVGDISGAPYEEDMSEDLWAGKIGLNWTLSDDALLYGSISRGVKAGAFNAPLPLFFPGGIPQEDIGYDSEELLAYEVGAKTTLFGGRAQLNAAAYFYDYSDYHAFQWVGVSGIVSNEDAELYGFEVDLVTSPVEGLDIILGYSYNDGEVKDLTISGITEDKRPSYAPKNKVLGMVRYEWPMFGGKTAVQMDGNWQSKFYDNLTNYGATEHGSQYIGNARLSYEPTGGQWSIAAFVNNFTDERNVTVGFDLSSACGCAETAYQEPRWWGVNFIYNLF